MIGQCLIVFGSFYDAERNQMSKRLVYNIGNHKKMKAEKKASKVVGVFRKQIEKADRQMHVLPSKDGWTVKRGRSKRAYRSGRTFLEAVKIAKGVKSAEEVVIHYKDGTFEKAALN